jgi:hypothetical protein
VPSAQGALRKWLAPLEEGLKVVGTFGGQENGLMWYALLRITYAKEQAMRTFLAGALFMTIAASIGCGGTETGSEGGPDLYAPPDMPQSPVMPENGVQIATPLFTLQPGEEVFKCYYTSIDSDTDVNLVKFQSWMPQGSHHYILYRLNEAPHPDGTLADCPDKLLTGDDFTSAPVWLFASQIPANQLVLPAGVGMPLKAHQPLMFNMHYINVTKEPITVGVTQNLEFAKGDVTRAGSFVTYNTKIDVPPNGTQTVEGHCAAPTGAQFFMMSTHSHKRTTRAVAKRYVDGVMGSTLVDTKDWEHPTVAHWDPNFMTLADGEHVGYSCSYQNTTSQAITVGDSAEKNEMCMVIGYFFPATANRHCFNSLYFDL